MQLKGYLKGFTEERYCNKGRPSTNNEWQFQYVPKKQAPRHCMYVYSLKNKGIFRKAKVWEASTHCPGFCA